MLVSVVGQLFDGRANPLFVKLAGYFESPKSWAAAIREHRRVLDALAAHDADAARAAMRSHMQLSHKRFSAGWPDTKKRVSGGNGVDGASATSASHRAAV